MNVLLVIVNKWAEGDFLYDNFSISLLSLRGDTTEIIDQWI